jgi:hypothetical protein
MEATAKPCVSGGDVIPSSTLGSEFLVTLLE